jgi:chromosomal replication initiation ATPase DnaA
MDELQPILMRIAAATGYTLEQVKIKDRHKEIVLAREIYVRELCAAGYLHWQVGKILARDRSTISYAMSAYERDYETDEMFRQIADRAKGNNII